MPFEVLETFVKSGPKTTASLSYMRGGRRKGHDLDEDDRRPLKLNVTIPTTVFLSKREKFRILIGHGTDAGKLRIEAHDDGVKPVEFKSHIILRFGRVPAMGDEMFDKVDCQVERVSNDVYELTAPPGLLTDASVKALRAKVKAA